MIKMKITWLIFVYLLTNNTIIYSFNTDIKKELIKQKKIINLYENNNKNSIEIIKK